MSFEKEFSLVPDSLKRSEGFYLLLLLIGFLTAEELKDKSRTVFLGRLTNLSQGVMKKGIGKLLAKGMLLLSSSLISNDFSSSSSSSSSSFFSSPRPPSNPPPPKRPKTAGLSPHQNKVRDDREDRKIEIREKTYPARSPNNNRVNPTPQEKQAVVSLAYQLGFEKDGRKNRDIAELAVKEISILNGYPAPFTTRPLDRINEWRKDTSLKLTSPPPQGKPGPQSVLDRVDKAIIFEYYRKAIEEVTDEASWDEIVCEMNEKSKGDVRLGPDGLKASREAIVAWFNSIEGSGYRARTSKPSLTPQNMAARFAFCMVSKATSEFVLAFFRLLTSTNYLFLGVRVVASLWSLPHTIVPRREVVLPEQQPLQEEARP